MPAKHKPPYPKETLGLNFFEADCGLQRILQDIDPAFFARNRDDLSALGDFVGNVLEEAVRYTDRYASPKLETHDREGRRQSHVVFNPLYDRAHAEVYRQGVIGKAFADKAPEPHLYSFIAGYLLSQSDISVHCPMTMTGAVAHVLQRYAPKDVADAYLHDMVRTDGQAKTGGTWCTELHGGSDIGATTTRAEKGQDGKTRLYGLKWFTSNANSGLALATARPDDAVGGSKGLGLYLVPSHLADGDANRYHIRRLKDKLGTKGLATGEMDLEGAEAIEIVPPPHGLRVMMEALAYSRVHNAMSGAGVCRRAFMEAAGFAFHRDAFGKNITEYPMVQDALLDLAATADATLRLGVAAAAAFDTALDVKNNKDDKVWSRIVTALAKYKTAEDGVQAAKSALELIGGNGYTEEYPTARLYRDAQVLTVWEGPPNIQALELLRMTVFDAGAGGDKIFSSRIRSLLQALPRTMAEEHCLLEGALQDIEKTFTRLKAQPSEGDKYAKRLLQKMADLLSCSLMSEAAARDLISGDARAALITTHLVHKSFAGGDIVATTEVADRLRAHFHAIIAYDTIDAANTGYIPVVKKRVNDNKGTKP